MYRAVRQAKGTVDRRYWIGFNLVKGIGPVKFRRLLDHFGDLEAAWNASLPALVAAGLDRRSIENLHQVRGGSDLDDELREIDRLGVQVLTWDDADYPRNLRVIAQPPPILYIKGALKTAYSSWKFFRPNIFSALSPSEYFPPDS